MKKDWKKKFVPTYYLEQLINSLTVEEHEAIAVFMDCSRHTIYRWLDEGQCPERIEVLAKNRMTDIKRFKLRVRIEGLVFTLAGTIDELEEWQALLKSEMPNALIAITPFETKEAIVEREVVITQQVDTAFDELMDDDLMTIDDS